MRGCINEGFSREQQTEVRLQMIACYGEICTVQSAGDAQQIFLNRIKARMIQDAMQTTLAIARVAVSWVYLAVKNVDDVDLV